MSLDRKREAHPSDNCPMIAERILPGPWPKGMPAAHVEVARGSNGMFYARWAWMIPTCGSATPISHSKAFATEADAVADRLGLIAECARKVLANDGDHYSETDRSWARKIGAWCADQIAPQQLGLGF